MARAEGSVDVELVQALGPRQVRRCALQLPASADVAQACAAAAAVWQVPVQSLLDAPLAVWGRKAHAEQVLRAGDRVEVLRTLQVDPKEARRLRYRSQAERGRSARRPAARGPTSSPSTPKK